MANVPNSVEIFPKITTACMSRVHERYRRQTDDIRTGDSICERSRSLKAKFHYAIWFEAGSKLDPTSFEPVCDELSWSQTNQLS